jgi:hypothetical protein
MRVVPAVERKWVTRPTLGAYRKSATSATHVGCHGVQKCHRPERRNLTQAAPRETKGHCIAQACNGGLQGRCVERDEAVANRRLVVW